jgi:hypothetical protein
MFTDVRAVNQQISRRSSPAVVTSFGEVFLARKKNGVDKGRLYATKILKIERVIRSETSHRRAATE